ncbi:WD40 repeat-like protein [Athelia psychrophila]|uniref:WD40 repeat-like protein n=1 Tax=Athelia psychrophila TaxID=1759441 RepID=A0A166WGL1_9AGAM|nr:WD40 repeat-like protein [Fibularhizoctonia sp. CBS 109695]
MSFSKQSVYAASPGTTRGLSTKLSANKGKIVYTNGKTVIIRDLNNPALSVTRSQKQNVSVARISPTGYYCASGDATGTVRIWDIVGEDQVEKGEYKAISGKINDLEWDGESKRIIAVGDGREKFGHAFMMDTGTSTGDITGHNKVLNAVAIRHQRPYRAATAGDDALIIFHQGAPYQFNRVIKTHTKFVQDVRYAPSGDHFASVGSDCKLFIYDGKTGDTVAEFTDGAHKGSVMACTWSPDSKSLATSSMDRTVKLWDIETQKATATWTLGAAVTDQQVGNVWSGAEDIVSLSLSGDLNIFDRRVADKPARVVKGTQKAISALAARPSADTFVAGTADGRVVSFDAAGEASYVEGAGHATLITGIAPAASGKLFSIGYDDRVREIDGAGYTPASISTASQPRSIAVAPDGTVFVAEISGVEAIRDNLKISELKASYEPSTVAASGSSVAVGEAGKVHIHEWDGKSLMETAVLGGNKDTVTALAFSPDGTLLAAGDSKGTIMLFALDAATAQWQVRSNRWSRHTSRVNALSWTADSRHCASGSLDTDVYVWSVAQISSNIAVKNAGMGGVNGVLWIGDGKLASAGADACVRIWEVRFH